MQLPLDDAMSLQGLYCIDIPDVSLMLDQRLSTASNITSGPILKSSTTPQGGSRAWVGTKVNGKANSFPQLYVPFVFKP